MSKIKVDITSDASKAKKGFKQVQSQAEKTAKKIQSGFEAAQGGVIGFIKHLAGTHPVLTAIGAGIGLITAGMVKAVNWAKNLSTKYDGIAKSAKSLNMDPMQYQSLIYAGNLTGVDPQKMTMLLNILIARQAEAVNGSVLMIDAFEKLGITIKELKEMKPAELITQIARNLEETPESQYGLTKIFGVRQAGNIRKLAKEDIGAHQAEFYVRYGIPPEALAAGEAFNDEMYRFEKGIERVSASVEAYLGLQDKLTQMYKNLGDVIKKEGKLPPHLAKHFETREEVAKRLADSQQVTKDYEKWYLQASKSGNPFLDDKLTWLKKELHKYDDRFKDKSQDIVAKRQGKSIQKIQDMGEKFKAYESEFTRLQDSLKKPTKFIADYIELTYTLHKDVEKLNKAPKPDQKALAAAKRAQKMASLFSQELTQVWVPDDAFIMPLLESKGVFDELNRASQLEIAKHKGVGVETQIMQNAAAAANVNFREILNTLSHMIAEAEKAGDTQKVAYLKHLKENKQQWKTIFQFALYLKQKEHQLKIAEAAADAQLRKISDEEKIKTGGMEARREVAYRQWQEQYGFINEAVKKKIDKILEHEFKEAPPTFSYQSQILTNELARRGGFTSSVVETLDPNRVFQNKMTSMMNEVVKNTKTSADNSILR